MGLKRAAGNGNLLRTSTAGRLANTCFDSCNLCTGSTEDRAFNVTFAGFTDNSCGAGDCSNFNATFNVADQVGCSRIRNIAGTTCGQNWQLQLLFLTLGNGNVGIQVSLFITLGPSIVFEYDSGGTSPLDCSSFSSLSIPFKQYTGSPQYCTVGTCSLTSV